MWTQEQFERDGYVLVEGVIGPDIVTQLRNEMMAIFHQGVVENRPVAGLESGETSCRALLLDVFSNNPQWFFTICNRRVVDILQQLLGSDFVLTRDSTCHWDYYNDWHADTTTSECRGMTVHHESDWRMVTVGMYFQDNNMYGGGLSVLPGSHKEPDPLVEARRMVSKNDGSNFHPLPQPSSSDQTYKPELGVDYESLGIDLPSKAGDVIIFDMRLIHRSTHPKSKSLPANDGKLALFSRASRNVPEHIDAYSDFLMYDCLKQPRDISILQEMATPFGFRVV